MELRDEPTQTRLFFLHGVLNIEGHNSKTLGGGLLPAVRDELGAQPLGGETPSGAQEAPIFWSMSPGTSPGEKRFRNRRIAAGCREKNRRDKAPLGQG